MKITADELRELIDEKPYADALIDLQQRMNDMNRNVAKLCDISHEIKLSSEQIGFFENLQKLLVEALQNPAHSIEEANEALRIGVAKEKNRHIAEIKELWEVNAQLQRNRDAIQKDFNELQKKYDQAVKDNREFADIISALEKELNEELGKAKPYHMPAATLSGELLCNLFKEGVRSGVCYDWATAPISTRNAWNALSVALKLKAQKQFNSNELMGMFGEVSSYANWIELTAFINKEICPT